MHTFLRSIGLSGLRNEKDINTLIRYVIDDCDGGWAKAMQDGRYMREYSKNFGYGMKVVILGEEDKSNNFYPQLFYPVFDASAYGDITSCMEEVTVEKNLANDSFYAAVDDVRIGTSLIFFLANMINYIEHRDNGDIKDYRKYAVHLTALAESGTILLPLQDNNENKKAKEDEKNRIEMIKAAQNGDPEAMESLTIEEFDTYSMLIERIEVEDIYTIVDSFIMPKGITNDRYSVMGTIEMCEELENMYTREKTEFMRVRCNGIPIDICINKKDLVGEPQKGRRFKGDLWLHGKVDFGFFDKA